METVDEKLAWLRTAVAIALSRPMDPEARQRLEIALRETAPSRTDAVALRHLAEIRAVLRVSPQTRPQAMGQAHKENDNAPR